MQELHKHTRPLCCKEIINLSARCLLPCVDKTYILHENKSSTFGPRRDTLRGLIFASNIPQPPSLHSRHTLFNTSFGSANSVSRVSFPTLHRCLIIPGLSSMRTKWRRSSTRFHSCHPSNMPASTSNSSMIWRLASISCHAIWRKSAQSSRKLVTNWGAKSRVAHSFCIAQLCSVGRSSRGWLKRKRAFILHLFGRMKRLESKHILSVLQS